MNETDWFNHIACADLGCAKCRATVAKSQARHYENKTSKDRLCHFDIVLAIGYKTAAKPKLPEYKFREDQLLQEFKAYIDGTYGQHYSHNKFQASEFIFDNGHGVGMNIGCIMKYAQRYGKKDGHNRKDILKILHYALLLLYVHDEYIAPTETK